MNRKANFIVFDILNIYSGAYDAKINKEKFEILILEMVICNKMTLSRYELRYVRR